MELVDRARRDEGFLFAGHEEDHIDIGIGEFVGGCQLEFVFEVADGSQTADQMLGPDFLAIIDGEARIEIHFDVGEIFDRLFHHRQTLFDREGALLGGLTAKSKMTSSKTPKRAFQDIEMAIGDRIETARINCFAHTLPPEDQDIGLAIMITLCEAEKG
jgi:hypothetical protein